MNKKIVLSHFKARAAKYDKSSRWCTDDELLQQIYNILSPGKDSVVLDTACGTGLVAKRFKGHVKKVVGLDITEEMFQQARPNLDHIVHGSAEQMPFKDNSFDVCYERQGIQFMDTAQAVSEMARVTRPGGKIGLVQLCAYGSEDREEYFKILKLRNPARRNFFFEEDLKKLLEKSGCHNVDTHKFISEEDVDVWADNGAIETKAREEIRNIYTHASKGFDQYHAVKMSKDGHVIDRMLFVIAVGVVPEK